MSATLTTVGIRDSRGKFAHVRFYITTGTPANMDSQAGGVVTALANLISGHIETSHGAHNIPAGGVVYGSSGVYASAEDKATLVYTSTAGGIHRFQIPTPLQTIFLADNETVDPANTDIVAFVAATAGILTTREGAPLANFVNGIRVRRRLQRRINIFSATPIGGPEE